MKNMTKKDAQLFTSFMFYLFTLVLTSFVFAFPIMAYLSYPLLAILLSLLFVGFALPSFMMVMLQKCYWLVSSWVSNLFQEYSLPLIGQEQMHKTICTLQTKIFIPLRNVSAFIVICYVMLILTPSSTFGLLSTFLEILLQFTCWSIATLMAINGIFTYSVCLFEIIVQLSSYKRPKRAQKFSLQAMYTNFKDIFTRKEKIAPKRLLVAEKNSIGENIFLLKTFVIETYIKLIGRLHIMKNSIIRFAWYVPIVTLTLLCLTSICSAAEAITYETAEKSAMFEEIQSDTQVGWFYEQLDDMGKAISFKDTITMRKTVLMATMLGIWLR